MIINPKSYKMNKLEKTTVCIDSAVAERIAKFASQHGKTRNEIIAAMAEYFAKNGIDPVNAEPPTEAINRLAKRNEEMIKLFRAIEKDSLRPMILECQKIPEYIRKVANYLATQDKSIKNGIWRLHNEAVPGDNYNEDKYKAFFSDVH